MPNVSLCGRVERFFFFSPPGVGRIAAARRWLLDPLPAPPLEEIPMKHSALSLVLVAVALFAGSLTTAACSAADGSTGPTKPDGTKDSGTVTDKNAPLDPAANDPL